MRRPTLLLARRLATIRAADLIVVLEDGRVAESGTHAELFARDGRYRNFYQRQFGLAGAREQSLARIIGPSS